MMGFGFVGILFLFVFLWALISIAGGWGRVMPRDGNSWQDVLPAKRPGAREILDQRYARGEISREEYERMKGDLGAS